MWARIQSSGRTLLADLLQRVRRYPGPPQIALAVAVGATLGLLPKLNFFSLVLLALMFRLRINLAAGLISAVVFSVIGLCFEPFLHRTGFLALTWQPLQPVWTWIYNLPLVAWTSFNNTLVLGGLLVGAYLFLPLFLFANWGVERYQAPLAPWIRQQRGGRSWWASVLERGGNRR